MFREITLQTTVSKEDNKKITFAVLIRAQKTKFATCNISAGNDDPTHSSVGHVFHFLSTTST